MLSKHFLIEQRLEQRTSVAIFFSQQKSLQAGLKKKKKIGWMFASVRKWRWLGLSIPGGLHGLKFNLEVIYKK